MIRDLHQKGWSKTAIAKETGFDRKTISKYLKNGKIPKSSLRKKRGSKLDPFKPYLLQRIQEGTTNCVVVNVKRESTVSPKYGTTVFTN